MKPGLSLAHLSIPDAGQLELLEAAAAAGFDAVNMWLVPPRSPDDFFVKPLNAHAVVGDARLTREIKLRVASGGVHVAWASCGWIGAAFDVAEIARVLDTAAEIGVGRLAVVGWDPDRSRLVANLAAACAAAARYDLSLTLEFMPYSAVRGVADVLKVVASTGASNLDLMIDALHLARSGGKAADLAAIDPARIVSVQLCDAPKAAPLPERLRDESVNRRLFPGEGELPLDELMDALPPGAVVEVEVPSFEHAALPLETRAKLCAERTRRYLDAYRVRRAASPA